MGMNKSLQTHVIKKILEKHGIDSQAIDLEAEIDGSLTLPENVRNICEKYGLSTPKELDDEYIEEKNNELLEEYLRMNGIEELEEEGGEEEKEEANETEELIKQEMDVHRDQINQLLTELVKKQDPLNYFSRYLFPEVIGEQYDFVRKAVLLSLATHRDVKKRSRIHVLLIGPPGSGKTEILLWLQRKLNAYFVNAEYASKVGLAGDARGKEVTPGALAEADGMMLAIDELDKMKAQDQSALLQAMEEGQYTIIKGKHRERFRAEVRVIAAANDINRIQKPLRDRFDFVIELKVPSKEERAENAPVLVDQFFGNYEAPEEEILHEYLAWIRDFEPSVENAERIKDVIKSYIRLTSQDLSEVSYRSLELSILRVAYALAKLQKSDVNPEHTVRAITLKDNTLTKEQIRYLEAVAKGLV